MDVKLLELVQNAMSGDVAAVAELCEYKAKDILYICTHLVGDPHNGQDAAQEVLLKLNTDITRLRRAEAFPAWLNRIISHTCASQKRQGKRQQAAQPLEAYADSLEELYADFLPTQYAEQKDKAEIVLRELKELPLIHREVLLLYYYENLSLEQISLALEINESTTRSRMRRARLALKKRLEAAGFDSDYSLLPSALALPTLTIILQNDAEETTSRESLQALLGRAFPLPTAYPVAMLKAACIVLFVFCLLLSGTLAANSFTSSSTPSLPPPAESFGAVPQQPPKETSATAGEGVDGLYKDETSRETAAGQGAGAPNGGPQAPAQSIYFPASGTGAATAGGGPQPEAASEPATTPGAGDKEAVPPVSGLQPSSQRPASSAPSPSATGEASSHTPSIALMGQVEFVTREGDIVTGAGSYAEGFTVQLIQNGEPVAEATVDATGAYALPLALDSATYTLLLQAPSSAHCVPYGQAEPFTTNPGLQALPALYITDETPPSGSISFYADSTLAEESPHINPAAAHLYSNDSTEVATRWEVVHKATGKLCARGNRDTVHLESLCLPGAPGGTRYTLYFEITDLAGNQTVLGRDFVVFESG